MAVGVMGRVFIVLFGIAFLGMFFFTNESDKTVSQEEALKFQEFLAKQPPEGPTETPKPTRVPGYGRPMFHAESDEEDKKKAAAAAPKKLSFEAINGEKDKFAPVPRAASDLAT